MINSKHVDKNSDLGTVADACSFDEAIDNDLFIAEVKTPWLLDTGDDTSDKLTDQMLTLLREYCPINLHNHRVLQKSTI